VVVDLFGEITEAHVGPQIDRLDGGLGGALVEHPPLSGVAARRSVRDMTSRRASSMSRQMLPALPMACGSVSAARRSRNRVARWSTRVGSSIRNEQALRKSE
jgi:hypothetical protein